jgi:sugar phosphate isomerase/epimerase
MFPSLNARVLGLHLSAAETLELAAAAGFGGVDLMVRDLVAAGEDPIEVRARGDDLGLRGGAWPLPVDWRGDRERFRHDLDRLPRFAAAAATLGLTRTGTWVLPETSPEFPGGRAADRRATFEGHVERLRAVARVLAEHGSRLGLEVIGVERSRTGLGRPFLHRLADLGPLLEAIRAEVPGVGVLIDGFHLYAAGEDCGAGLTWGIEGVVWVHVADLPAGADSDRARIVDHDRGLPGENGAVDSRDMLRRLADLGYDGPVTAEPLSGCRSLAALGPEARARSAAAALRSVWPTTAASRT